MGWFRGNGEGYTRGGMDVETAVNLFFKGVLLFPVFLFAGYFDRDMFSIVLGACGLCLAALNVSQIKTPKLSGNPVNVALLATYTLAITFVYGSTLL